MLDLSLEDSIAEDYAVEGIRASTPVIFLASLRHSPATMSLPEIDEWSFVIQFVPLKTI
jgi:hypothetical protein